MVFLAVKSQSHRAVEETLSPDRFHWIYALEPMIMSCCRALGLNADQVEEATAETFLAALKGASSYRGQASRSTWLWRIAYFQAINVLRRVGRDQACLPIDENLVPHSQVEPWQELAQAESHGQVYAAIRQLPEAWATAIEQFYWHCKSTQEIADTMNVTSEAVRVYLYRGRNRLRGLLTASLV